MDEDTKDIADFFERIALIVNESKLQHADKRAVICKILVLLSINDVNKAEFISQLAYAWEFEKFFQPDSSEIH